MYDVGVVRTTLRLSEEEISQQWGRLKLTESAL